MNKLSRVLPLAAAILLTAHVASASSIEAGDWVHVNGTSGTLGGGAFALHDVTDPDVADFLTFCLQESQTIDYGHDFRVGSITDFADDAAGDDPLDAKTAWLMSNFSRGLLASYSADDIQWAVWKLEGEQANDWGNSASLIQIADLAILGGWSNDGVKVLNLFWADGTRAQDQMVYLPAAVPEPATIGLLGIGLAALFQYRRRARRLQSARLS